MTFIVESIVSEGGLTATTLNSTTISSVDFSATTLNGSGSGITGLIVNPTLTSPNFSVQYDENNVLSGSSKFTYDGSTLVFSGTTLLDGLFYRTNSPSVKQVHQWVGAIAAGTTPGIIWTNMPLSSTTWLHTTNDTETGDATFRTDFTEYSECKLYTNMQVAGANTDTSIYVEYSTNNTTWSRLVTLVIGNTTGAKDSGWVSIPAGAQTLIYIRLLGIRGSGAVSPRFSPPILIAR